MRQAALAALLFLSAAPLPAAAGDITGAQHLPTVPLTIRSAGHVHLYHVEVARTAEQQEIGLMFRTAMARNHGMIFPGPARVASFWMKNTLISLDLIFIREDGTISSIAAHAPPRSLDIIPSSEPVTAVLELKGGEAGRAGLKAGDHVRW